MAWRRPGKRSRFRKYRLRKGRIALALLFVFGIFRAERRVEEIFRPSEQIAVGSWNLNWLGTPEYRGRNLLGPKDIEGIASLIQDELHLAVVTLQEINVESWEGRELIRALTTRGYTVAWGNSGNSQRVLLAYDTQKVRALGNAFEGYLPSQWLDVDGCRTSVKAPLTQNFVAGNFDFTVIAVHLKANAGATECQQALFPQRVRAYQAEALVHDIVRLTQGRAIDRDVILLGDFNEEISTSSIQSPAIGTLVRNNLLFLTNTLTLSENSGLYSFRNEQMASAVDHVAVSYDVTRDYVAKSTRYLPYFSTLDSASLRQFRMRFSDHCPVLSEFKTDLPDDD